MLDKNELAVEFYESLDKLYTVTTEYRNALRSGNQIAIIDTTTKLSANIQSMYDFYEKNSISDKNLADKANALVRQFNVYVPYYNEFANSTDKMSVTAQECALKAERAFNCLVEMLVSYINEIKPYVQKLQEQKEQAAFSAQQPQINNNITVINQINVDVNVAINQAKSNLENGGFDEATKKEVLQKLEELKQIADEKSRKKNVWEKVKNALRWVAEQSIQVASVVVPVLVGLV